LHDGDGPFAASLGQGEIARFVALLPGSKSDLQSTCRKGGPNLASSAASLAREVLLPLSKYGGAQTNEGKTRAEKEICFSQAQTAPPRRAQA
jgi:hypothetical protein